MTLVSELVTRHRILVLTFKNMETKDRQHAEACERKRNQRRKKKVTHSFGG